MSMSGIDDAHDRLASALVAFDSQWSATRSVWRDHIAGEFERHHGGPIDGAMKEWLRAIARLEQELEQAEAAIDREG